MIPCATERAGRAEAVHGDNESACVSTAPFNSRLTPSKAPGSSTSGGSPSKLILRLVPGEPGAMTGDVSLLVSPSRNGSVLVRGRCSPTLGGAARVEAARVEAQKELPNRPVLAGTTRGRFIMSV